MAGSNGRSGQGVAITFGTTSFSANMHMIGGLERSRPALETSHLGLAVNSERTRIPGDLIDLSVVTIRFEWNQSFGTFPPITSDPETITITFPLRSGESTNATLVATGFAIRDKGADIEVNSDGVMMGEIDIQFDGLTGPTYTAGS